VRRVSRDIAFGKNTLKSIIYDYERILLGRQLEHLDERNLMTANIESGEWGLQPIETPKSAAAKAGPSGSRNALEARATLFTTPDHSSEIIYTICV